MLVAKLNDLGNAMATVFENYVNYAGSKTNVCPFPPTRMFENYVNYAGSKTVSALINLTDEFENYVNYAGSKTTTCRQLQRQCLRTM